MIVLMNLRKYNLTPEEIESAICGTPLEIAEGKVCTKYLDDEISGKLESCLLERFIENLNENDEPNNIGKFIDDLIGTVVSRNSNEHSSI